jgi:hypothetical protein
VTDLCQLIKCSYYALSYVADHKGQLSRRCSYPSPLAVIYALLILNLLRKVSVNCLPSNMRERRGYFYWAPVGPDTHGFPLSRHVRIPHPSTRILLIYPGNIVQDMCTVCKLIMPTTNSHFIFHWWTCCCTALLLAETLNFTTSFR